MFEIYRRYERLKKENKLKPRGKKMDTAGLLQKAGEPFCESADNAKIRIKEVKDAIARGYRRLFPL
jgi:hypothetical protein